MTSEVGAGPVEGRRALKTRFKRMTPHQILVWGFLFLIAAGTLLLSLPISVRPGGDNSLLTALFTATSALCVVGLVVVDTGTNWSTFGHVVILLMIMVGGMGFMAAATLILVLAGKRIGLRQRLLIQESLGQPRAGGVVSLIIQGVAIALAVECLCALVLAARFIPDFGWGHGLWMSIFHSISAFNNAGFDLFGDFRSLTAYTDDVLISLVIAVSVLFGGLGFIVLVELCTGRSLRKLSLHSKVVLATTAILLALSVPFIFLVEYSHSFAHLSGAGKAVASFFQAVTARSAGFSTTPTGDLHPATLFFTIGLMFIGGGPSSVAGGIKVTTFAILVLLVWSLFRGRSDVDVARRRIPHHLVVKAVSLALIMGFLIMLLAAILCITEEADPLTILFEATSAVGIVGLSMGLTPYLSPVGKLLIIVCMFIGRLGPLTVALALTYHHKKHRLRYPEEQVLFG